MNTRDTKSRSTESNEQAVMPRVSAYGFHCGQCGEFVYKGFDTRDKYLPDKHAVCIPCGEAFEDKAPVNQKE